MACILYDLHNYSKWSTIYELLMAAPDIPPEEKISLLPTFAKRLMPGLPFPWLPPLGTTFPERNQLDKLLTKVLTVQSLNNRTNKQPKNDQVNM